MIRATIAVLVLALAACEGPTGPEGPAGPQGEPGPGTRVTFEGQIGSDGTAQINLPREAGTVDDMPSISVFVSQDRSTWLAVSDGYTSEGTPWYAVGELPSGALAVVILETPAGAYYQVVVVY